MGDIHAAPPLVRIHSQCLTGDVFHSMRCDCRQQLELALSMITEAGAGILIYEQQEGRGIGLMAKLQAYELQDKGLDTVEANVELGYDNDYRQYKLPAAILQQLGVKEVRLISNNPDKVAAVEAAGIKVVERVSAEVEPYDTRKPIYVRRKRRWGICLLGGRRTRFAKNWRGELGRGFFPRIGHTGTDLLLVQLHYDCFPSHSLVCGVSRGVRCLLDLKTLLQPNGNHVIGLMQHRQGPCDIRLTTDKRYSELLQLASALLGDDKTLKVRFAPSKRGRNCRIERERENNHVPQYRDNRQTDAEK